MRARAGQIEYHHIENGAAHGFIRADGGDALMAWVRYDDQLSLNAKITAALLEDPGVMSLHLMANTWTSTQKKTPGYIPAHQPGALIFDRTLGAKWADILVRNNLWHERGKECDRCAEAYADAPTAAGYVVHDFGDYRPPASERQTPGTPADLSEKRAAAGRAGGKATAKRREQVQQNARANQANLPSKDGNLPGNDPSPVPVPEPVVASNEATDATPVASLPSSQAQQRPKRGTRIPDDFAVDPEMVTWAREHASGVDIGRELVKFRNHWLAKSGKDATKLDWKRTWQNWMLTAAERQPARASPGSALAVVAGNRPSTTDLRVNQAIAAGERVQAMLEGKTA